MNNTAFVLGSSIPSGLSYVLAAYVARGYYQYAYSDVGLFCFGRYYFLMLKNLDLCSRLRIIFGLSLWIDIKGPNMDRPSLISERLFSIIL